MAIDFPIPSVAGETFDPGAGVVYTWDGTKWIANGDQSYVRLEGDNMIGDLTVPSLNENQLAGFRNILRNPNQTINQRATNGTNAGDYVSDGWKITVAGRITQVIEEGTFAPNTQHHIFGLGVTQGTAISPASGNWDIGTSFNIQTNATNLQLEPGPVATPFEYRPAAIELQTCLRYFQSITVPGDGSYTLLTPMRIIPGTAIVSGTGSVQNVSTTAFQLTGSSGQTTIEFTADL